jgi:hypothetical protein
MARMVWGCLGLVALAGCGDDPEKEDPLATVAGFCEAWSNHTCNEEVVDRCSENPNTDKCLASQTDFCLDLVDSDEYEKAGAEECLKAVDNAYKDGRITAAEAQVVLRLGPPCSRVVGGSEPACKSDGECADYENASCEKLEGASVGTCVINGGYSCDDDDLGCAMDFFCDEDKNCVHRLDEGDTCAADAECAAELKCAPSTDDPRASVCAPRKDTEEACKGHDDCQSRFCADAQCTTRVYLTTRTDLCDDLS